MEPTPTELVDVMIVPPVPTCRVPTVTMPTLILPDVLLLRS